MTTTSVRRSSTRTADFWLAPIRPARSGSPPCALTLVCRHAQRDATDELAALLVSWEAWCSELLVSHLSYPMLSYYRSQRDNQSWLAGLAAVMDACALIMVGLKDSDPLRRA